MEFGIHRLLGILFIGEFFYYYYYYYNIKMRDNIQCDIIIITKVILIDKVLQTLSNLLLKKKKRKVHSISMSPV